MRWIVRVALCALMGGLAAPLHASALAIPVAPSLETPIVDQTKTLSAADIEKLSQQIAVSRQQKSYQIGILLIPTLGNDEYLEGYSLKVSRAWGIGEKDKSNGVLILVVKNDRKMRIEVGRGLEGDLTDVRASRIIRDVLTPAFRKGDFAGGLSQAVDSVQKAVSGQADPVLSQAEAKSNASPSGGWVELFAFAIFWLSIGLTWVGSMLARSKSWWAGGVLGLVVGIVLCLIFSWALWTILVAVGVTMFGFIFDFLVSRNYSQHNLEGSTPSWWAGGGSIGGGGGWSGGGGFGGGGFSGGGSSGNW